MVAVTATAGAAHAVNGPAVTDPALAFSVQLKLGDSVKGCSGVLVNRWWVATAKSCFGATVTAGAPPLATTATIGRLDLNSSGGHVRTVDKIVPHPERDVVLARLAEPALGATAVKIGTTPPATGDALVAAGYGRTADRWVPDALHAGDFTVTAVGAATLDLTAVGDATICKGDAGGPVLRRTSAGYELVGLHHTSYQGGCLSVTETRRDAVETRVDDLAAWFTANTPIPNSLQVSVTDTRIGVLRGDYGTQFKEGGLSAKWNPLLADAKDIVVAADRIGVLTQDGAAWVKEGPTTATFVRVQVNVKQLALSGNRIGVVTNDGVASVKEGGLSANWIPEHTGVQQVAVTDTRVGVLTTAGVAKVKEGGLSAQWIPEQSGVKQIALSGNRIGVVLTNGAADVKEGGLSAGWSPQATAGVASLVLNDDRVGLLTTAKVAQVREGKLDSPLINEQWNVRHLSVSGSRVGVVLVDGSAEVKQGGLSAPWTPVW
ncbi:trypsin-like serine protease [Actinoplanes sp. M2I2]|uniref:S1 family peptidase n=1 Tax=Actinoplanes sp. M2I2 TaxID=1734444 RepID=UPI002021FD9F|nr:trypsin-like serine protease [Actinoplanes sp. M2I2]